jgi:hypothetical protein
MQQTVGGTATDIAVKRVSLILKKKLYELDHFFFGLQNFIDNSLSFLRQRVNTLSI